MNFRTKDRSLSSDQPTASLKADLNKRMKAADFLSFKTRGKFYVFALLPLDAGDEAAVLKRSTCYSYN